MRPQNSDPISGFLTTDTPDDDDLLCRSFSIPNDTRWLGNFMGALLALTEEKNWKPFGNMTPTECADAYAEIIRLGLPGMVNACPSNDVPAPVWDEDSEVDDESPGDIQPWYGEVTNPEAPPEELEFVPQLAIWVITGFLAIATVEIGSTPAIAFAAIAPKFALAQQRGELGEIIKIFFNLPDAPREFVKSVDTTPYAPGEVIEIPIIVGEEYTTRNFLVTTELAP